MSQPSAHQAFWSQSQSFTSWFIYLLLSGDLVPPLHFLQNDMNRSIVSSVYRRSTVTASLQVETRAILLPPKISSNTWWQVASGLILLRRSGSVRAMAFMPSWIKILFMLEVWLFRTMKTTNPPVSTCMFSAACLFSKLSYPGLATLPNKKNQPADQVAACEPKKWADTRCAKSCDFTDQTRSEFYQAASFKALHRDNVKIETWVIYMEPDNHQVSYSH